MRRVLHSVWHAYMVGFTLFVGVATVLLAVTVVACAVSLGWHHFAPEPDGGWVSYYPGAYYWSGGR